jgi:hypothetical protein
MDDPFSQLSLDQLAHLLSHVDIKPQLSSCSLVSSTWRTAAARATTSITVGERTPLASFEQWLWAHTTKVQVSSLTVYGEHPTFVTDSSQVQLRLPTARQSLKELNLQSLYWSSETAGLPQQASGSTSSSSTRASKQGLAGLTALTSLTLSGCAVKLAGLSALTGLQELSCERANVRFYSRRGMPAITDEEADLFAALPELQRLTSLTLRQDLASTAVVSQVSTLQSLQRLTLDNMAADSFAALPQSLTELNMSFTLRGSLTSSNAAGLSQLTALQSLDIIHVQSLDLSLLAGMRDLRSLQLSGCELAAGALQVVSHFSALTCLKWWGGVQLPASTITAAQAHVLTSSSQLAELHLHGKCGQLQLEDYASLFPPGRQLQHLTELLVTGELLRDSAAVIQAGNCCPNLHSLVLTPTTQYDRRISLEDDKAATVVDSLAAMSAWSSLRQLQLQEPWPQLPPAAQQAAWEALGTLSQLTALHINLWQVPTREDVLHLTSCTALRALHISCDEGNRMCFADLTSTVRLLPTAAG